MKILHIAWGIVSRNTSLAEYVNNLLEQERAFGWDTYCFFPGRYDQKNPPYTPRIVKYRKSQSWMYELINSPNIKGGEQDLDDPEMDLQEPQIEALFRILLNEIKPDLIHLHEMIHLCTSLIDIIKDEFHIPIFMTCHDYFLFCPIVKLFDYQGNNCIETQVGEKCAICVKQAKSVPLPLTQIIYQKLYALSPSLYLIINSKGIITEASQILTRFRILRRSFIIFKKMLTSVKDKIKPAKKEKSPKIVDHALALKFQKRRDVNVTRLNKIDLFMPHSFGCGEIYKRYLGSQKTNFFPIDPIHKHLENMDPKQINAISKPIYFGTIAGFVTKAKGADLLLETVELLNQQGYTKDYFLVIFGSVDPRIKDKVLSIPNIINRGFFKTEDLNNLLNEVQVGLVPSIWEEVFGVVGTEFLAKGIPIIGNKRGGIPDYTIENVTGWLNKSATPQEMAEIMIEIIKSPQKIIELNKKIIQRRTQFIYPMRDFYQKVEELYQKILKK